MCGHVLLSIVCKGVSDGSSWLIVVDLPFCVYDTGLQVVLDGTPAAIRAAAEAEAREQQQQQPQQEERQEQEMEEEEEPLPPACQRAIDGGCAHGVGWEWHVGSVPGLIA